MSLLLADARGCADRAIARAQASGLRIAVVVLNGLGELVQLDRMDGAAPMTADIAEAKARTALNFAQPTSELAEHPERLQAVAPVLRFQPVTLPGGVPMLRQGAVIGAIGISGADAKDEEIARAALG